MPNIDLEKPIASDFLRSAPARGLKSGKASVEREGGDNGAGIVRGAAVITRGEALGHGMWIDAVMLRDVHEAINAAGQRGIKARFTHPGLSSDGLGSFLGRFKNAELDGDIVRADLHLAESAHDTPDGDLASYVMNLAEEDPEAFGASIVFKHDGNAEEDFETANQQPVEEKDYKGQPVTRMRFRSPDPKNTEHLPHARLKQLRAIDAVDSPAANPSGLFHATDVAHEAESLLSYALGLSAEKPQLSRFEVDPDRTRAFVARFFSEQGLSLIATPAPQYAVGDRVEVTGKPHMDGQGGGTVQLVTMEPTYGIVFDGMENMGIHRWYVESELKAEDNASADGAPAEDPGDAPDAQSQKKKSKKPMKPMPGMGEGVSKQEHDAMAGAVLAIQEGETPEKTFSATDLQRFRDAFGERGTGWFLEGKSFEDCEKLAAGEKLAALEAKLSEMETRHNTALAAITQERDELKQRIAAAKLGEEQPVSFSTPQGTPERPHAFAGLPEGLQRYAGGIQLANRKN